jgi:carbonic anhydrase/acetyltransferase-like protein (isoleucine patch superfamily)
MVKLITPFRGKTPNIHPDAFVDRSARVIGDVIIDKGANIWPMSVLRADSAEILIGTNAAVLDLAMIEAPARFPVIIEMEALISHRVVIHGARVMSRALVGIGAIILDGAIISSGSIIGAGSVVLPGVRIPPNSLVTGMPGKIVRQTTEGERGLILAQINELFAKSRLYKNIT